VREVIEELEADMSVGSGFGRAHTRETDAVVLDLEDGHFAYVDGAGNRVRATRRFRTRHVIRAGRRLPASHSDTL